MPAVPTIHRLRGRRWSAGVALLGCGLAAIGGFGVVRSAPNPVATPVVPHAAASSDAFDAEVSADGRWVVFASAAGDLVPNDTNETFDVFLRDRAQGITVLVSANQGGTGSGSGASLDPTLSPDARYVLFRSSATNLVAGDTNQVDDVFRRDVANAVTDLVSVSTNGVAPGRGPSSPWAMTPEGRWVLFDSWAEDLVRDDGNRMNDLFVRDMESGTTALVTRDRFGNALSSTARGDTSWDGPAVLSDDGRWVVFGSSETALVVNDTNNRADVFARDLLLETNLLVSASTNGTVGNQRSWAPVVSADGRYVAFQSLASNLVPGDSNATNDVFLRDLVLRETHLVSVATNGLASARGASFAPVLSAEGRWVAFFSFANNLVGGDVAPTSQIPALDLFVRDLATGTTVRVSTNALTTDDSGAITRRYWTTATRAEQVVPARFSPEARFVVYHSDGDDHTNQYAAGGTGAWSTNLYQLGAFVWDRSSGIQWHLSGAACPRLSGDGTVLVFQGTAASHWAADPSPSIQVFGHRRADGATELLSGRQAALSPVAGDGPSWVVPGALSATGRFVAFESAATDLAVGDTNQASDVFVRDILLGTVERLDPGGDGAGRQFAGARTPVLSPDGRWVAFETVTGSAGTASSLSNQFNLVVRDRVSDRNAMVWPLSAPDRPGHPPGAVWSGDSRSLSFVTSWDPESRQSIPGQILTWRVGQSTARRVSIDPAGAWWGDAASWGPQVSEDGRRILFFSTARNLTGEAVSGTHLYLWDAVAGAARRVSRFTNEVVRLGGAALSGDGRFVAFVNQTNLYLSDSLSEERSLVAVGASEPSLDYAGRRLVFVSRNDLVPEDTNALADVYRYDRMSSRITLVSRRSDGSLGAGSGRSSSPRITPSGRYVVFTSQASDLGGADADDWGDVFLGDLDAGTVLRLSADPAGVGSADGLSASPVLSADGSTVAFARYAGGAKAGDFNQSRDVFVLRLETGDGDADGMADDWEVSYFGDLGRDGTGDADGDGASDGAEFRAGTQPTLGESVLRSFLQTDLAGGVTVLWSAIPGRSYRVQYKDSLETPGWADVPGDVLATQTTAILSDPTAPAAGRRYYRVLALP